MYFGLRKVVYIYHDYVLMHAETIVGFYTADESDTAVHEAEIHAAIVALVPIALLAWLCTYLPKGFMRLFCISSRKLFIWLSHIPRIRNTFIRNEMPVSAV